MTNTTVWLIVANTDPYTLLDVALTESESEQDVDFYREEFPDNKVFAIPHNIQLASEVFLHTFFR